MNRLQSPLAVLLFACPAQISGTSRTRPRLLLSRIQVTSAPWPITALEIALRPAHSIGGNTCGQEPRSAANLVVPRHSSAVPAF
jgi:hypothetical protein